MSIVKTRSFLERSGCGLITSIIIGAVIFVGLLAWGGGGRLGGDRDGASTTAFEVGDLTVSRGLIEVMVRAGSRDRNLPVQQQVSQMVGTVSNLVQAGFGLAVAKDMGVTVGKDIVDTGMRKELDDTAKRYAQMMGQTDVEAFKKSSQGRRVLQDLTEMFAGIKEAPSGEDFLRAHFAMGLVLTEIKKGINPSDDEIKHLNDQLSLRSIFIKSDPKGKPEDLQKKVDQVMAEIKASGFLKVSDKYSTTSVSSATVTSSKMPSLMMKSQVASMPDVGEALSKLKVGEYTAPLDSFGQKVIYYLAEIKDNSPKDFDKQKAQLRSDYVDRQAGEKLNEKLKAVEKKVKINWVDKAYEAIYDLSKASPSYDSMMAIAKKAETAETTPGSSAQPAILARYAAIDTAWNLADPKQKKDMREKRAEILEEVLGFSEEKAMRLELIDLYIDLKAGTQAKSALATAADTAESEKDFADLEARASKLLSLKLIQQKDVDALKEAKAAWQKQKAEDAKYEAEMKKKEADQAAADAKLEKEQAAAAKKGAKDGAGAKEPAKEGAASGKEPVQNKPAGK